MRVKASDRVYAPLQCNFNYHKMKIQQILSKQLKTPYYRAVRSLILIDETIQQQLIRDRLNDAEMLLFLALTLSYFPIPSWT